MVQQTTHGLVGVVEDDHSTRTAIARLLQVAGFEPALFESAEAFLDNAPPESALLCVIVDVQLGGMSGVDLQCRLRASGCRLPILMMTAHCDRAIRDRAVRNGCEAFLSKPFAADILLDALASIASRRASDRASIAASDGAPIAAPDHASIALIERALDLSAIDS
jgi:FixJ family two-component response regulator